jgi:tetratricopeptide (TPR) repeat protein
VVLLAACAFLVVQNRAAAATVDALATRVPQLLLPVGEQNPLDRQLTMVRQSAGAGNFLAARETAAALALPPGMAPASLGTDQDAAGPGAGAAPGADNQAPVAGDTPQAEAFFHQHPDLGDRLGAYVEQALALKNAGKDVQPLRDLRTQILNAATAGDAGQVSALLDKVAQGIRALGGNPEQKDLPQIVADFQKAYETAHRENRDPRAAVALMNQAEAAAQAGNRAQAAELARQALAAIQRAPKLREDGTGLPPSGPGPSGPALTQAKRLLSVVMPMVDQEDHDLPAADEAVQQATQALQKNDPAQTRAALAQAQTVLARINQRRQAVGRTLSGQSSHPSPAGSHQSQPPPSATQPAAPPAAAQKLGELFDRVRGMTPQEYKSVKDQLVQQMVGLLLVGGPAGEAAGPPDHSAPAPSGSEQPAPPPPAGKTETPPF